MKKKILKITIFSFVVAAAVVSSSYSINKKNSALSVLLSQVEAFATGEPAVTTWNCNSATTAPCKASCLNCEIKIEGSGVFSGKHTCKTN